MKWKQIFVGGIFAGIVIEIISMGFSILFQTMGNYNVLDLAGMRTIEDPIGILFFIYPWILGFALTFVYAYFEEALDGDSIKKGWNFGLIMWIVIAIPSAFLVFSSMNYTVWFTINSVIGSLVYMLVTGIVIAKIFEKMD